MIIAQNHRSAYCNEWALTELAVTFLHSLLPSRPTPQTPPSQQRRYTIINHYFYHHRPYPLRLNHPDDRRRHRHSQSYRYRSIYPFFITVKYTKQIRCSDSGAKYARYCSKLDEFGLVGNWGEECWCKATEVAGNSSTDGKAEIGKWEEN